jgi:drug/metabolite transporter (DMT)-like permease
MTSHVLIAVSTAVMASLLLALSNVLEQREAEQVDDEHALRPGLLTRLLRRPLWLAGLACDAGGYAVAAVALGFGAVAFVAPILSAGIMLWTLLLGVVVYRRRTSALGWAAGVTLAAGVAVFLREVSPTGGTPVAPIRTWLVAAVPIVSAIVVAVSLARASSHATRGALLGLAAGTAFGVGTVLTRAFAHYVGEGYLEWLRHWEPYMIPVATLGGLLLLQSAYQTGSLAAATGASEITSPICSIVLSVVALHEQIAVDSVPDAVGLVFALVAMLWGVATLARVENPPELGIGPRRGSAAISVRDTIQ